MKRYFHKEDNVLAFALPSTKLLVLGSLLTGFAAMAYLFQWLLGRIPRNWMENTEIMDAWITGLSVIAKGCLVSAFIAVFTAVLWYIRASEAVKIRYMTTKALFYAPLGNPLHLLAGELLPQVQCVKADNGYDLSVSTTSVTPETVVNASESISAGLRRRYRSYAVTQTSTDLDFSRVIFHLEDVTTDKHLVYDQIGQLDLSEPTKIVLQRGTCLDLTSAGSILVAGKTRSGKTTGIMYILLNILSAGRDEFHSEVIVADPKKAELSCLPHVYTLSENGEAKDILDAIRRFADTITFRQKILNDLSVKSGDAVRWYDAGFHPSILFIDEYVALRSLFPQKAAKENPGYSLNAFDSLLKRIITMGASSGSFVILSIAEASVSEGGLPSMLRSALTTKILFRPTLEEARFLWDSEKLNDLNNARVYHAGEAWFSSTDGIHDGVSCVVFPEMKFSVYRELGKLLDAYYKTC